MDSALVLITLASLGTTGAVLFYAARLIRDERTRSNARVTALADEIGHVPAGTGRPAAPSGGTPRLGALPASSLGGSRPLATRPVVPCVRGSARARSPLVERVTTRWPMPRCFRSGLRRGQMSSCGMATRRPGPLCSSLPRRIRPRIAGLFRSSAR